MNITANEKHFFCGALVVIVPLNRKISNNCSEDSCSRFLQSYGIKMISRKFQ